MKHGKVRSFYEGVRRFNSLCASLSGIILIFITFSIFIDVFQRYVFNRPSIWITEVTTYLLLYLIFLGTSYALQQGVHIRVSFLSDLFQKKVQDVIRVITSLLALIFCVVLLWQTSKMTWMAYSRKWTSPTMLNVPLTLIYIGLVFGSFMLLLTLFLQILLTLQGERELDGMREGDEQ